MEKKGINGLEGVELSEMNSSIALTSSALDDGLWFNFLLYCKRGETVPQD